MASTASAIAFGRAAQQGRRNGFRIRYLARRLLPLPQPEPQPERGPRPTASGPTG